MIKHTTVNNKIKWTDNQYGSWNFSSLNKQKLDCMGDSCLPRRRQHKSLCNEKWTYRANKRASVKCRIAFYGQSMLNSGHWFHFPFQLLLLFVKSLISLHKQGFHTAFRQYPAFTWGFYTAFLQYPAFTWGSHWPQELVLWVWTPSTKLRKC